MPISSIPVLLYGLVGIGSLCAALIAVFNYNQKRTEWLFKLYEKYYGTDNFREIEQILFYRDEGDLENLELALKTKRNRELLHKIDEYLNFFELVGSLRKLRRLRLRAIKMLFLYNLTMIAKQDSLREYIKLYGYENLDSLVDEVCDQKGNCS
jgi:hypothetical protein